MMQHLLRVSLGLLAALVIAVLSRFVLFDAATEAASVNSSGTESLAGALIYVLVYALPPALLAIAATEILRFRRLSVQAGIGTAIAFASAYFSTFGEELTSSAFSGGALTALFVTVSGLLSAIAYWLVAGRRAGWRGDAAERSVIQTAEAFRTASANAQPYYCKECLAGWSVLGLLAFLMASWLSIETSGLRNWLIAETETRGKEILSKAGHAWATFKVEGDRGVIEGLAPDEAQKRAAYDSIREALASVTGFPGVLAQIENQSVARQPMAEVAEQLAQAERRESEAQVAAEAARIATETARAAEAEVKRRAEEQATAAEAEIRRKLEEQVRAVEAETKKKLEEQARAAEAMTKQQLEEQARSVEATKKQLQEQAIQAEAEIKRKLEEQAIAAETELKRKIEEQARAEEQAKQAAAAQAAEAAMQVEVAAVEPPPAADVSKPEAGNTQEQEEAAPAPAPVESSGVCSPQDLAIVESARIMFDQQLFEITEEMAAELDRLAASAQACAPRPILVTGHADPHADSLFNRALGLQRAEAVRTGLIERGVPETLVMAQAAGHSDDAQGDRNFNRRAEFRFLAAAEASRDAKLDPEERATTCESELSNIMAQSIIHFPSGSARISDESYTLIRKIAKAIQTCGSVIVTVEGHTDKIGAASYNQGLSESRSNSVKEALIAAGADQTRLAAKGFASSRPYDAAETAEAYALNRRIEFKVSGKFSSTNTGGP